MGSPWPNCVNWQNEKRLSHVGPWALLKSCASSVPTRTATHAGRVVAFLKHSDLLLWSCLELVDDCHLETCQKTPSMSADEFSVFVRKHLWTCLSVSAETQQCLTMSKCFSLIKCKTSQFETQLIQQLQAFIKKKITVSAKVCCCWKMSSPCHETSSDVTKHLVLSKFCFQCLWVSECLQPLAFNLSKEWLTWNSQTVSLWVHQSHQAAMTSSCVKPWAVTLWNCETMMMSNCKAQTLWTMMTKLWWLSLCEAMKMQTVMIKLWSFDHIKLQSFETARCDVRTAKLWWHQTVQPGTVMVKLRSCEAKNHDAWMLWNFESAKKWCCEAMKLWWHQTVNCDDQAMTISNCGAVHHAAVNTLKLWNHTTWCSNWETVKHGDQTVQLRSCDDIKLLSHSAAQQTAKTRGCMKEEFWQANPVSSLQKVQCKKWNGDVFQIWCFHELHLTTAVCHQWTFFSLKLALLHSFQKVFLLLKNAPAHFPHRVPAEFHIFVHSSSAPLNSHKAKAAWFATAWFIHWAVVHVCHWKLLGFALHSCEAAGSVATWFLHWAVVWTWCWKLLGLWDWQFATSTPQPRWEWDPTAGKPMKLWTAVIKLWSCDLWCFESHQTVKLWSYVTAKPRSCGDIKGCEDVKLQFFDSVTATTLF